MDKKTMKIFSEFHNEILFWEKKYQCYSKNELELELKIQLKKRDIVKAKKADVDRLEKVMNINNKIIALSSLGVEVEKIIEEEKVKSSKKQSRSNIQTESAILANEWLNKIKTLPAFDNITMSSNKQQYVLRISIYTNDKLVSRYDFDAKNATKKEMESFYGKIESMKNSQSINFVKTKDK